MLFILQSFNNFITYSIFSMSADLGSLKTDPLFLGLTRPSMIGGVTFVYFAFEMMLGMIIFIVFSSFKLLLIVVAMHIIGMQLCKKEPLAIDILLTHFRKTPPVPNKSFHGGLNSYNMFG